MIEQISNECVEFELVCKYSKKLNGTTMSFPYMPYSGDKLEVEGKRMIITSRVWDHSVSPPVVRLEVHLDH